MSATTNIGWTNSTWNPINGCTIVSPGCTNCYAMRLAGGRMKHVPSRKGLTVPSKAGPVWTGKVRFDRKVLDQPLRWRKPRRIFVCAHGDLFHEAVPDEWIDEVFAVMALSPQHTFLVLTKRPEGLRKYLSDTKLFERVAAAGARMMEDGDNIYDRLLGIDWPLPNVWLGVSAEDQKRADERVPVLLNTPAAKRFVSAEPLLGPLDLKRFMWPVCASWPSKYGSLQKAEEAGALINYKRQCLVSASNIYLDWVIAGGESQNGARPMHPDWARGLRDQCAAAEVPFFFKQWGVWAPGEWLLNMDDVLTFHPDDKNLPVVFPRRGWKESRENWWAEDHLPEGRGSYRLGKAAAGNLLDGRKHEAIPGGFSGPTHGVRAGGCWACGGSGEVEHECMEDSCACLNPEPGVCPECEGEGAL